MTFEPCAFVSICLMSKQYLGQAESQTTVLPQLSAMAIPLPLAYHAGKGTSGAIILPLS